MLNWFIVYTKPRHEDSLSARLVEKGFDVLNPKIRERKYIRRKTQDVVSPLFPCYVFVKFESPKDYRLIKYARGVKRIVGSEGVPTAVPEHIIAELQRKTEGGALCVERPSFTHGEPVSISAGPFEGLAAVFERELHGSERVSILLMAINARVAVDAAILKKIV